MSFLLSSGRPLDIVHIRGQDIYVRTFQPIHRPLKAVIVDAMVLLDPFLPDGQALNLSFLDHAPNLPV
jgi:hypothetical protein